MKRYIILLFTISTLVFSCESEEEKGARIAKEEQEILEQEVRWEKERVEEQKRIEAYSLEQEVKKEKERKEQEVYDKYINNSLRTGASPYSYCYGKNKSCSSNGCSQIKVKAPNNSDVIVLIKRGDKVFRHAYIKASDRHTLEFPNGTYQTIFYYGNGWNPEKIMKKTNCGILKGGFISNDSFDKDSPQTLENNVLSYELILQKNGNFSTSPSNVNEAF
jgi:hypothetical protein